MRGRACPAALVALLLAGSLCGRSAPGFAASAASCPGCLLAGAASMDITLPIGVPLAGYGGLGRRLLVPDILDRHPYAFWLKPSTGVHVPIKVRALVLERDEVRLLWLALDVVGVSPELVRRLKTHLAEAGWHYSAVIVAASHTHSGPGGYAHSGVFEFFALDRYVPEIADRIVGGMVRAVDRAEARKVPAQIGSGSEEVSGLTKSRVDLPLDPEVGVLKVVAAGGSPLALVWNYAIHGTTLGKKNLRLSGDVMGVAGARLERALGIPALYTNGAVGDVSPALHGLAGAEQLGEALAQAVLEAWRNAPVEEGATLRAVIEPVRLPPPRLSLRNCLGRWLPRSLTLGLGWALPKASGMVGVAIGPQAWVTVPGELQTRLGREIKREGRRHFPSAFVIGLANDYLGYFLARAEYHKVSYIACASLYGETAGQVIVERAKAILRRLGGS